MVHVLGWRTLIVSTKKEKLEVDKIVEKAFEYFDRFVVRDNRLDGVLLEELEPQDDGWVVAIGFNGKRQESSEPASVGAMAALSGFGSKTTTTVREVRHIYLGSDGGFQKIA
jgi:hypothetical protein